MPGGDGEMLLVRFLPFFLQSPSKEMRQQQSVAEAAMPRHPKGFFNTNQQWSAAAALEGLLTSAAAEAENVNEARVAADVAGTEALLQVPQVEPLPAVGMAAAAAMDGANREVATAAAAVAMAEAEGKARAISADIAPTTADAKPTELSPRLKALKQAYHTVVDGSPPFLLLAFLAFLSRQFLLLFPNPLHDVPSFLAAHPLASLAASHLALAAFLWWFLSRPVPVYMLDSAVAKLPEEWSYPAEFAKQQHREMRAQLGCPDAESEAFFDTMVDRLGLGDRTAAFPPARGGPDTAKFAAEEFPPLVRPALDALFAKTGVDPKEIGILVVHSTLSLVPSTASYVVNMYGMREGIKSMSLAGMGCSAGVIAVDIARDLLQVHRNTYALVVNASMVSSGAYYGKEKPAIIIRALIRNGCSAVLLTNKRSEVHRCKYRYVTAVRTHLGANDEAFRCLQWRRDAEGIPGHHIAKSLIPSAGQAIKRNIASLGPKVLPFSEQLLFAVMHLLHAAFPKAVPKYVPDFKLAFDHFLFHVGGSIVLDTMERSLGLEPRCLEASRSTLHRWGNVSDASVGYCLAFAEAKGRVRRGDCVWQIQFGSGFKCASVVWRALRSVEAGEAGGAWADCLHEYPRESKTVYDFNPWKK